MLAVRFWVLPRINEWRPLIEQHLADALSAKVRIGSLAASWSGLSPTLTIENLTVSSDQDVVLLQVPDAFATVSWSSVLDWDLRLHHLEISGIDLSISRDEQGAFTVAGFKIDSQPDTTFKFDTDTPVVKWLLNQGKVIVHDATVRWSDQLRGAPEFILTDVDLALTNGLFTHGFLFSAELPEQVGKRVELIVKTNHLLHQISAQTKREAELYLEAQDVEPASLAPWIDLPAIAGRFAARAWVDVVNGQLGQTVLEVVGNKLGTALPVPDTSATIFAKRADLQLTAMLSDLLPQLQSDYLLPSKDDQRLKAKVSFKDFILKSPLFDPSELDVGNVSTTFELRKKGSAIAALDLTDLSIDNPHLQMNLTGTWASVETDPFGQVDLKGTISQLSASQLHQYLTPVTDDETRHWLRDALTKGQFNQVSLALKGELNQFPFTQPGEQGEFQLKGQFKGLSVDYAPPQAKELGWPPLSDATGQLDIDKVALSMRIDSGTLLGWKGEQIAAQSIRAGIPNLLDKPVLSLDARTQGQAKDYLGLLRGTPLNASMGNLFDQLGATGIWQVPLALEIDLARPEDTKVKGQIVLAGSTLTFGEDQPALENIQGTLDFSNTVVRANQIAARFLGGDVVIEGVVGEPGGKITIEGNAVIAGMREYSNQPSFAAVKGKTKYRAQIAQNTKEGLDVILNSSLEGLAITLPAPLGKAAQDKVPMTLRWSTQKQKNDLRHSVSFSFGEILNGRFEKAAGSKGKAFFTQGAVAMGAPAELPSKGMSLALSLEGIDWNEWGDFLDKVTAEGKTKSGTTTQLFPVLDSISLRTPRFVMDDLTFTDLTVLGSQTEAGQWQVTLRSKETEGSISWQLASGALAGRVRARFSRLELGSEPTSTETTPNIQSINESQWSDIPAIDLTIDDFKLYGSRLGSLHLRGENIQRGESWNIESLDVKNPFATLTASGKWRLKGGNRGIHLDANIDISDLGKLTSLMGHPDRVREGSGTVKAQIDWNDFPWVFSYVGMNGKATVNLEKGVFEHVNSRSARLLELLSLQSLQRILSFNFRPGNQFKDGYPWSEITGSFELEQGVASTMNLKVDSPVATISLVGSSDLNQRVWNMDADVKPRFDMSGTAVATGFVVNPLVGVSALVTQFLLRNPIERAMTVKYQVRGPWDDPTLEPLESPKSVQPEQSPFSGGGN